MFILHFSPITGVVGLTKEFHRDKVKPTGVMIVLKNVMNCMHYKIPITIVMIWGGVVCVCVCG